MEASPQAKQEGEDTQSAARNPRSAKAEGGRNKRSFKHESEC